MTDPRLDPVLTRALGRRGFLQGALGASAAGAAIYAVGCGSDRKKTPPTAAATTPSAGVTPGSTANAAGIKPVLLTSEYVAGVENRFAVGLMNGDGKLILDAAVHLKFFSIASDGVSGTLRGEGDAAFTQLNIDGAHAHDETTGAASTDDAISFYVANAPFDAPGTWGVEVDVTPDDGSKPVQIQVPLQVLRASKTPNLGTVPPASRNDTALTVAPGATICTRSPVCPLHDKVIGDVLGKGRPLVVQFSTPAFCQTRFCGPVLEVLLAKVPEYQDRIDFVHIEVWQDFQLQTYRPTMAEWKLDTEPFTFFMGSDGRVALKIEAIFTEEELASALEQLAKL